MAGLDLVSNNNQDRDSKTEEDRLWERSEDVTSCSSAGAIFYNSPHTRGDLAQKVAEDKTNNNSLLPALPSGHHSASLVKGRKAAKGSTDDKKGVTREHLFNSGMCSGRR